MHAQILFVGVMSPEGDILKQMHSSCRHTCATPEGLSAREECKCKQQMDGWMAL